MPTNWWRSFRRRGVTWAMVSVLSSAYASLASDRALLAVCRSSTRHPRSHHHVKVPMEQTAATGRGGATTTGRGLPRVQARRQWNDVCALGLRCVPEPHGDQTQPVVATPELRYGRLLCSCRSRSTLRLRRRGAPAFVSTSCCRRWATFRCIDHPRRRAVIMPTCPTTLSGSSSRSITTLDCLMRFSCLPLTFPATGPRDWAAAVTECPEPPQATTIHVRVAIESCRRSSTSAEAQRRRLAGGLCRIACFHLSPVSGGTAQLGGEALL